MVRRLSENVLKLPNNDVVMRYLKDLDEDVPLCITVPIYGPAVDQCSVVESLLPRMIAPDLPLSRLFHLDVQPSVGSCLSVNTTFYVYFPKLVNCMLFALWLRKGCFESKQNLPKYVSLTTMYNRQKITSLGKVALK